MIILPEDVCNYILSFLPVKDPKYDQCIDQLKFLYRDYEGWRIRLLNHPDSTWVNKTKKNLPPLQKYVLGKNRTKREIDKPIKYSSYMNKKIMEHRQKLRRHLLQQKKKI